MKRSRMAIAGAAVAAILVAEAGRRDADAKPWDTYFGVSEMDDSQVAILTMKSSNEIWNDTGIQSVRPELVIRCSENKTVLYVDWKMFITTGGIDDEHGVRYRVDDDKAKRENWRVSTNFEATGLWSGGRSIPLIKRLVTAKRLIVETTPYSRNAVSATFNVEGLDIWIGNVKKACHWN